MGDVRNDQPVGGNGRIPEEAYARGNLVAVMGNSPLAVQIDFVGQPVLLQIAKVPTF